MPEEMFGLQEVADIAGVTSSAVAAPARPAASVRLTTRREGPITSCA